MVLAALSALVLLTLLPERSVAQPAGTQPVPVNPLKVGTLVEFDARAQTVGDAFSSMLEPVRYRVTDRTVDPMVTQKTPEPGTGPVIDEIAARAALSPGTVRNYLSSAISKLGAANRHDACATARRLGWI